MRRHNGMRPQDIAILIKMISLMNQEKDWKLSTLATSLCISLSEVSESLNRSKLAGLVDFEKKRVNRKSLFEFIEYGIKYVFPHQEYASAIVRGVPTALSHPFMKESFQEQLVYVWPYEKGEHTGFAIEPLYNHQAEAVLLDEDFYKMMALIDVIRLGRVREKKVALEELRNTIIR